jgi:hypothetical protein
MLIKFSRGKLNIFAYHINKKAIYKVLFLHFCEKLFEFRNSLKELIFNFSGKINKFI